MDVQSQTTYLSSHVSNPPGDERKMTDAQPQTTDLSSHVSNPPDDERKETDAQPQTTDLSSHVSNPPGDERKEVDAQRQVRAVIFYVLNRPKDATEVDVRIERPDILRRRSVTLRDLIDKKAAGKISKLLLEPDSKFGIDRSAVQYVLENLQRDAAQTGSPPGNCDLETLALHCAVLWQLECIPDPFEALWIRTTPRSSSHSQSSTPTVDGESSSSIRYSWRGRK